MTSFVFDIVSLNSFPLARFIPFVSGIGFDPLDSQFLNQVKNLPKKGEYKVFGEENRLDLVSFNLYGDTAYWWVLMCYNQIANPFLVKTGTVLNYPSVQNIQGMYLRLRGLQSA